jgi:PAS domain S-box-containing protein
MHSPEEAVLQMDRYDMITEFDAGAEKMFGYDASAVIGKPLSNLIIPENFRSYHLKGLQAYIESDAAPGGYLNKPLDVKLLRADRTSFPVSLTISPIGNDKMLFRAVITDLSPIPA